jgi:hypothetical protein
MASSRGDAEQEKEMPTDLNEICQKARELPDADKLALVDSFAGTA